MKETDVAASFFRGLGVGLAILIAGTFLWVRLQDDAEHIQQIRQNVTDIKQTYRHDAAILTCWEKAAFSDTNRPKPVTRIVVPPLEYRNGAFNFQSIDQVVDRKHCKIDTNAQNIDIALHDAGLNRALAVIGFTQRFAAQTR